MTASMIRVGIEDGAEFLACLILPPSGSGPGIVMLSEIFGINEAMRKTANYFAEEGYVVMVPDLFWRHEPDVAYDLIRSGSRKHAIASESSISTSVSRTSGARSKPSGTWKSVRGCPVVAHFGEADSVVPIDTVDRIRNAAQTEMMWRSTSIPASDTVSTPGVRAELAGQGTMVVGVMPEAVRTRMTETFPSDKMEPSEVANAGLDAVEAGHEYIYPGDMANGISQGLAADHKAVEKEFAAYLPE